MIAALAWLAGLAISVLAAALNTNRDPRVQLAIGLTVAITFAANLATLPRLLGLPPL